MLTFTKTSQKRGPVIGDRLKLLRERHGLTQKELAQRVRYSEHQLIRWESNETSPNSKALVALSKEFGVSVDYLAGLTDEPSGNFQGIALSPEEQRLIDARRRGDWQLMLHLMSVDEELRAKAIDGQAVKETTATPKKK